MISLHLIIVEDLENNRETLAELIREDCHRQGERADLSFFPNGGTADFSCRDGVFYASVVLYEQRLFFPVMDWKSRPRSLLQR